MQAAVCKNLPEMIHGMRIHLTASTMACAASKHMLSRFFLKYLWEEEINSVSLSLGFTIWSLCPGKSKTADLNVVSAARFNLLLTLYPLLLRPLVGSRSSFASPPLSICTCIHTAQADWEFCLDWVDTYFSNDAVLRIGRQTVSAQSHDQRHIQFHAEPQQHTAYSHGA